MLALQPVYILHHFIFCTVVTTLYCIEKPIILTLYHDQKSLFIVLFNCVENVMSTPAACCGRSFNSVYISLPTCEIYGALWFCVYGSQK